MTETWCIRGRQIERSDLDQIGSWRVAHPEWRRRRLSEELARLWEWRTAAGQLKPIFYSCQPRQLESLQKPQGISTSIRSEFEM